VSVYDRFWVKLQRGIFQLPMVPKRSPHIAYAHDLRARRTTLEQTIRRCDRIFAQSLASVHVANNTQHSAERLIAATLDYPSHSSLHIWAIVPNKNEDSEWRLVKFAFP